MASLSFFFGVQRPALPRVSLACRLPLAARSAAASVLPVPPAPGATKEDVYSYALTLQFHHTAVAVENGLLKMELKASNSRLWESMYKLSARGILQFFLDNQRVNFKGPKGHDYHRRLWTAVLAGNPQFRACLNGKLTSTSDTVGFLVDCHKAFNQHHHPAIKTGDSFVFAKTDFFSPEVATVLECMAEQLYITIEFGDEN